MVAHDRTCKTCGDPLRGDHGTYCPRCQWSEDDANLDRDPLSNPSDPFVDLNLGITPRAGSTRVIPSHRHALWFDAVSDL